MRKLPAPSPGLSVWAVLIRVHLSGARIHHVREMDETEVAALMERGAVQDED